jgi:hypothetical protein
MKQSTTQSKKFAKGVVTPQRISVSPSEGDPSHSKSSTQAHFKTSGQPEANVMREPAANTKTVNEWTAPKAVNDWSPPKVVKDWSPPKIVNDRSPPKFANDWSASTESSKYSPEVHTFAQSPNDDWSDFARSSSNVPAEPEPTAAISHQAAHVDQKIIFKYKPLRENSGNIPEIEDETPIEKVAQVKRSESQRKAAEPSSAIQLGGWGVASSPSWNENSGQSASFDGNGSWDAAAVERMTWQPAEIVNAPVVSKSAKKKGARLFLPASSEHDGWGAPPSEQVAWDDDGKQGFAHDIIQSQHQTTFWKMEAGVWKKLSAGEQSERRDHDVEDFSPISPHTGNALPSPPISRHILKSSSHQLMDNDIHPTDSGEALDEDTNQLSDDDANEKDFSDSDDGVVIKTGVDDNLAPVVSKAALPANIMDEETVTDYSESIFTELPKDPDSPPSHPGNPQWVRYEQWRKTQLQSTAIEHPEGSQAVEIPVDDGGWDDLPETLHQTEINGDWAVEKGHDESSPAAPIASYKLVDIIDDFNERISSRSTQSRSASDIKWEGFESSMFSDHDNEENDNFRQLAEDKHDATVQYIKAQAESRQIAREDIIRQTENDLISNSFAAQFDSEESKYAANINGDQYDSNKTDDDWVSSTTSETGYNMSGLGISNKVSRRSRNRESRSRSSARHPMRPEQMAGQWGLFPLNKSNLEDSMDHAAQSIPDYSHRDVETEETLDDEESSITLDQAKEESAQDFDLLNASSGSLVGSDHDNEFDYKPETPIWDEPDKLTEINFVNMDNAMPAASPVLEKVSQNADPNQSTRDFFDGLMGQTPSSYIAPLSAAKEVMPVSNGQGTTLTLQSPSSQVAAIPNGNSNVTILSVKIETVDAGTQPLVIMEVRLFFIYYNDFINTMPTDIVLPQADDPKQAIHDFCVKYGMTEYETKIVDVTLPRYKEKVAKRVLGRAARNNNSPRQGTASPTLANSTSGSMESLL